MSAADDRRGVGSRYASGCADASVELWSGGCRVLGDFFRALSDSAYRPARRADEKRDLGGVVREDVPDAIEGVATGVSSAFAEAGRTITRTADICADSLRRPARSETVTVTTTATIPTGPVEPLVPRSSLETPPSRKP